MIKLPSKFTCTCGHCYKESRITNHLANEFEPILCSFRSFLCPLRNRILHQVVKIQEPNPPEGMGEQI